MGGILISYTEDSLVQQTTANYLEQKLGWESVYAFNVPNQNDRAKGSRLPVVSGR